MISILLFYFVNLFLSNYRLVCSYKKSFSSMVKSCIIVNYSTVSHQEIDIGTIYQLYSDFSGFTWLVCVYVVICNFIACINLCNHCPGQDIELFHHYKDPSCSLLIALPTTQLFHLSPEFCYGLYHFGTCAILVYIFPSHSPGAGQGIILLV